VSLAAIEVFGTYVLWRSTCIIYNSAFDYIILDLTPLFSRAALSIAIEMYRAMDMTLWLPQAEAELAQTLRNAGITS
jgi:hypothetical protein